MKIECEVRVKPPKIDCTLAAPRPITINVDSRLGIRGPKGEPGTGLATVNRIGGDDENNAQVTVEMTQAAFDLIGTPDPRVMYFITD
jgi:hypothetical protein